MQKTSELYKKLIDTRGHVKEAELIVAGEEYCSGRIVSMETDGGLFEQETVSVGGCVSRQLDVVLYGAGDIPKGAKLIPRYRVRLGDQVSEWVQKGTFYIDTREPDKETGTVSIHAFDDFLRMETEWTPEQDLEFPMPMDQAAKAVAQHYGVEIDPRSRLRSDYYIDYPEGGTTGRQVLQWIAAAHGGNWTMTDAGLARLIRLRDLDSESGLLVTQRGRVIVINGYAIRVDKDVPGESYDGPSDKVYVGAYAASVVDPPALEPITKIIILVDDDAYFEAGDDSGQTLELTCPYGTQKMADDLLLELKGYRYKPVSAVDALIDPAAELGDGVTVNGVYTVLAQMTTTFDLLMASDIGAPGQREIESEIGRYVGSATKQFNRKIAQTRSLFKKSLDEIDLRVEALGKSTSEELEKYAESVTKSLGELQSQIDGNIMTWFYSYEPTPNNEPASLWTTDAEKIKHLGDVFYIVKNPEKSGQAYRWTYIDGQYGWEYIEDVELTKALADAARAQDTADKKRRVFVEQPTPPYDAGDLWAGGPGGDMMRCKTARESGNYDPADWEKASKYTDDSFASEKYTELDLKIGTIKLEVANGDTKSSLTLKVGETVLSSADIILKGVVTFEGLRDGTTVIDGGWVNADNLNLKGKITWGDLDSGVQRDINNRGISSDEAKEITKTTVDSVLIESPTIRGANIYGGKFWNTDGDAWLDMDSTASGFIGGLFVRTTRWNETPLFCVYSGDFDYGSIRFKGYDFLGFGERTSLPRGTWDFSNATVTGLGADYVTEQGTSGGWTYRKWNSGVAECWRTETAYNVVVTNQWGNIYVSNAATFGSKAYPFRFTSAPSVQVSPENANGDWWVATKAGGTTNASPGYQVCRGTQNSNMTCRAHFCVMGRWK